MSHWNENYSSMPVWSGLVSLPLSHWEYHCHVMEWNGIKFDSKMCNLESDSGKTQQDVIWFISLSFCPSPKLNAMLSSQYNGSIWRFRCCVRGWAQSSWSTGTMTKFSIRTRAVSEGLMLISNRTGTAHNTILAKSSIKQRGTAFLYH